MPLTGLVFLALGGVYAYFYQTSPQEEGRAGVNNKVAGYARILFPIAGVILILIWVVREIF
jgi:hypothetical protein